jgi:hypothetical protein
MPEPIDIGSLARELGRSVRTLKRWEQNGINLANHDEVKAHAEKQDARTIGASRNRARARTSGEEYQSRKPSPDRPDVSGGNIGAAGALQRLATTERTLYHRLQTALKDGNALAIADARTDWLQVSESLRRYDIAIEQSRRESGELIPRSESEMAVRMASVWLRLTWMKWLESWMPDIIAIGSQEGSGLREAKHKALGTFDEILEVQLQNALNARGTLPEWAIALIKEEFRIQ